MKDEELAELDLAVAQVEHMDCYPKMGNDGHCWITGATAGFVDRVHYAPTRDGDEAMRLLEKYRLFIAPLTGGGWRVTNERSFGIGNVQVVSIGRDGPTPAIAICRAVVALAWSRP